VLQLANNDFRENIGLSLPVLLQSGAFELKVLNLSNNKIGDRGIEILFSGLSHRNSLSLIDLSHNEISDQGLLSITENLKVNTTLQILSLQANLFTIKGLGSILTLI